MHIAVLFFFKVHHNINSHPAFGNIACTYRGNGTAQYSGSILHNKREENGQVGRKRRRDGWEHVKYVEEGSPFMELCVHSYGSLCMCVCTCTDSQCALMETMCSLQHGTSDKLFIGHNTKAIIWPLLLSLADGHLLL